MHDRECMLDDRSGLVAFVYSRCSRVVSRVWHASRLWIHRRKHRYLRWRHKRAGRLTAARADTPPLSKQKTLRSLALGPASVRVLRQCVRAC